MLSKLKLKGRTEKVFGRILYILREKSRTKIHVRLRICLFIVCMLCVFYLKIESSKQYFSGQFPNFYENYLGREQFPILPFGNIALFTIICFCLFCGYILVEFLNATLAGIQKLNINFKRYRN